MDVNNQNKFRQTRLTVEKLILKELDILNNKWFICLEGLKKLNQ